MMENFESIIQILDFSLNSPRKRHIVGGLLLSVSFLFGGLAITTMTLGGDAPKEDERKTRDESADDDIAFR